MPDLDRERLWTQQMVPGRAVLVLKTNFRRTIGKICFQRDLKYSNCCKVSESVFRSGYRKGHRQRYRFGNWSIESSRLNVNDYGLPCLASNVLSFSL